MNQDEFRQLVERHKDMLWRICSDYRLSDAWEVCDAMQEVVVELWKALPKLREEEKEKAWAYKVAHHTMLRLCRKVNNRPTYALPPDLENLLTVEEREDYEYLMELIGLLPKLDRRIVKGHIDGYSFKEIGDMVGLSEDAANMRYRRAMKKIIQKYENEN